MSDVTDRLRKAWEMQTPPHLSDLHEAVQLIRDLRADAARYRWLRSPDQSCDDISYCVNDERNPPYWTLKAGLELDEAIDAAMNVPDGGTGL